MFARRSLLLSALLLAAPAMVRAQDATGRAVAFVQAAGTDLAQVVNGPAPEAQKTAQLQAVVDRVIDVDEFGRFSLGRFWSTATPPQQAEFIRLFHKVLMNNVSSKISQYAGVSFTTGRAAPQGDQVMVDSTVTWPGYAPYNVKWLVSVTGPQPKIVDVVAQGTSLRQTQRSDYASYLARNGFDIAALLNAMRQQVGA